MTHEYIFALLLLIPITSGILSQFCASQTKALLTSFTGVFVAILLGCRVVMMALTQGRIFAFDQWLFVDELSAWHMVVLFLVFGLSSLFACVYLGEELREKKLSLQQAKTFAGLWSPAMAAMLLVLISNNLGIMWVGMEATTLLTSFLVCVHITRSSLEATWKYMLICSVGIGFAFLGTMLLRLAAKDLPLDPNQALLWTNLMAHTAFLSPDLVKAAFIFALVGYGTKAGLAPMHSWLPDAHSKAPSPVSAIFSGFMLNTALYCIMRYIPITEETLGHRGWALNLLTGFGLFSILMAAAFILFQKDMKRFLAYCSVEHLGIIALGLGLGVPGTFAALFHTLNHSLSKSLAFFSAGRLGQALGTHDIDRMSGSISISPIWGTGIFASILILIGIAPFALFMSEFQLLKAAIDGHHMLVAVVFLAGTGIIFIGALRYALPLAFGKPDGHTEPIAPARLDAFLVAAPLLLLLLLGLWMPTSLQAVLNRAAGIIQTSPAKATPTVQTDPGGRR
ncbi:MAG TPA: proton-conducting transporter membrane subunit [Candidatus Rifleibacterium sp.]|nr:proton-conducting transporter membrane subunit [Candidatus Rifleibacterium sp.]HPT45587.1 proton-conducting transporter membrane subunit [Candidatus Rifleibacterium sp.]